MSSRRLRYGAAEVKRPVHVVHVRCYAELNDALPAHRRQRRFPLRCAAPPDLGDVITILGLDAAAVDLALVDGRSVGWDERCADGAAVSLYPAFETFDVGGLSRVRAELPRDEVSRRR